VAASIVGLVDVALKVFQQIRTARDNVQAASKTLNNVSRQLEALVQSLSLVKGEERLQTDAIERKVREIIKVAEELRDFFETLQVQQQKRAARRFMHAIASGAKEEKELEGILSRLDSERDDLILRISVAQVGVVGNLDDGFRVVVNILREINEKVKDKLGVDLVIAKRLGETRLQQAGGEVPLNDTSIDLLGLPAPQGQAGSLSSLDTDTTSIYDNVTLGQARIMTGNVGVENWRQASGRKTTIAGNEFQGRVVIMTGDMGGSAAADFNSNFWGN